MVLIYSIPLLQAHEPFFFGHHCVEPNVLNPDSGQCNSALEVEPYYLCDDDGTLAGTQCITQIESDAILYKCEEPAYMSEGQCVCERTATPLQACVNGFVEHETSPNLCKRESRAGAFFDCEDPTALLNGNSCIKYIEKTPSYSCPSGELKTKSNGAKYCEIINEEPPSTTCPPGVQQVGSTCIARVLGQGPAAVMCEAPFLPIVTDTEVLCLSTQYKPALLTCMSGPDQGNWVEREEDCAPTIFTQDPAMICEDPQSTYIDGRCVKYQLAQAETDCHDGEAVNTSYGTVCVYSETKEFVVACPPNTFFNLGRCEASIMSEPIMSCPPGQQFDLMINESGQSVCGHYVTEGPISNNCPEDFVYVGEQMCEKTARSAQLIDRKEWTPNAASQKHCPGTSVECRDNPSECCVYFKLLLVPSCRSGFTYDSTTKTCSRLHTVRPVISCPPGTQLIEHTCHHNHHHHHHDNHHHHMLTHHDNHHHHHDNHHHHQLTHHNHHQLTHDPHQLTPHNHSHQHTEVNQPIASSAYNPNQVRASDQKSKIPVLKFFKPSSEQPTRKLLSTQVDELLSRNHYVQLITPVL